MPRARNIKPSLFKNEILGEADPLLTILFEGLWCLADRDGKLEDRPKRIKAEIFPYRELTEQEGGINGYLTVLQQLGFIDRYSVGETAIIRVLNFDKHQSPHKTEKPSELPDNPLKTGSCGLTENAPLNNGSLTVKESLIPDSGFLIPEREPSPSKRFKPPSIDEVIDHLEKKNIPNPRPLAESFVNFYESKGWIVGKTKMKSWPHALGGNNWIPEHLEKQSAAQSQGPRSMRGVNV